jgi:hypothetical protein
VKKQIVERDQQVSQMLLFIASPYRITCRQISALTKLVTELISGGRAVKQFWLPPDTPL